MVCHQMFILYIVAAAKAFNEGLFYHPVLVKICSEYFKTNNLKEPCMKLAHV